MNDFSWTAKQGAASSEKNSLTSSYNSSEYYFPFFYFIYLQLTELISLIVACKEKL